MEKYFPIKTETACKLKWSWSSIYLNSGSTGSCHRASSSEIEELGDFHNTPAKQRDRQLMLQGRWPGNGCEYCKNIESAGGTSDRLAQNAIPGSYPDILDHDPTRVSVDVTMLEVFFNNTCNLKCVYCSSRFSSSIQAEDQKFGGAILPQNQYTYRDNRYKDLLPQFWQWLDANGDKLKRLSIGGGEPFLQSDVQVLLNRLGHNPCPDLELAVVSNLMSPADKIEQNLVVLDDLLQQKKVKQIDVLASVDCWGHAQEYLRFGFAQTHFEQNFLSLLGRSNIRANILSTITNLSIPSMPNLALKFKEWNQYREVYWYMHKVLQSWKGDLSPFNPVIFDFGVFEPFLAATDRLLESATWDQKKTKDLFNGIVDNLRKHCYNNVPMQQELFRFLQENDRRRGTDWQKTFPWLIDIFRKNHVV